MKWGGGGADISPMTRDGVPSLSLDTVGEHYFDWHHTHADTLDKVVPADLRRATGMLAVMGYVLADMEEGLVMHPEELRQARATRGRDQERGSETD